MSSTNLVTETDRTLRFMYFGQYVALALLITAVLGQTKKRFLTLFLVFVFLYFTLGQMNAQPVSFREPGNLLVGTILVAFMMLSAMPEQFKAFQSRRSTLMTAAMILIPLVVVFIWSPPLTQENLNPTLNWLDAISSVSSLRVLLILIPALALAVQFARPRISEPIPFLQRPPVIYTAITLVLVGIVLMGVLLVDMGRNPTINEIQPPDLVQAALWAREGTPKDSLFSCFGYSTGICYQFRSVSLRSVGYAVAANRENIRQGNDLDMVYGLAFYGPGYVDHVVIPAKMIYGEIFSLQPEVSLRSAQFQGVSHIVLSRISADLLLSDLNISTSVSEVYRGSEVSILALEPIDPTSATFLAPDIALLNDQNSLHVFVMEDDTIRFNIAWQAFGDVTKDTILEVTLVDDASGDLVGQFSGPLLDTITPNSQNCVPDFPCRSDVGIQTDYQFQEALVSLSATVDIVSESGDANGVEFPEITIIRDAACATEGSAFYPRIDRQISSIFTTRLLQQYAVGQADLAPELICFLTKAANGELYGYDAIDVHHNATYMHLVRWSATKNPQHLADTGFSYLLVDDNWMSWLSGEELDVLHNPDNYTLVDEFALSQLTYRIYEVRAEASGSYSELLAESQ